MTKRARAQDRLLPLVTYTRIVKPKRWTLEHFFAPAVEFGSLGAACAAAGARTTVELAASVTARSLERTMGGSSTRPPGCPDAVLTAGSRCGRR